MMSFSIFSEYRSAWLASGTRPMNTARDARRGRRGIAMTQLLGYMQLRMYAPDLERTVLKNVQSVGADGPKKQRRMMREPQRAVPFEGIWNSGSIAPSCSNNCTFLARPPA